MKRISATKYMMLLCLFFIFGVSMNVKADTFQGTCGPNAVWTLDEAGNLKITGTGKIEKVFMEDETIKGLVRTVSIAEGITEIGEKVFYRLVHVKEVVIPSTVERIGEQAFAGEWVLENIRIAEGVKTIGKGAFRGCDSLKEIELPDSVTEIEEEAFSLCDELQNVKLPKKLESLERKVFAGCDKLESVKWPEELKTIGESSFSSCSMRVVTIPDTVTQIGKEAFRNCTNLKTITIGKSVQKVPKSFIKNCTVIRKVVNKSGIEVKLDTAKNKRSWYVGGKKSETVPAGTTAKAKGKKYKITYYMDQGKIKGKKPKTSEYGKETKLPSKVVRKGYTFFGWHVSAKNDWEIFRDSIRADMYGDIQVAAKWKKYSVKNIKGGKIKVTVKDPLYGKKGYDWDTDKFAFRYSEYKDMRDAVIIKYTAPYGEGVTKKLKKGKTYYVEVAMQTDWEEDDEDIETPISGWLMKTKIKITR